MAEVRPETPAMPGIGNPVPALIAPEGPGRVSRTMRNPLVRVTCAVAGFAVSWAAFQGVHDQWVSRNDNTPISSASHASASPTAAGRDDYLNTDSCAKNGFCTAVGAYSLGGHWRGLSETLSGAHWIAEPVASPSRGVNIFANEVSCASPSSCPFVGDHWAGRRGHIANLAEAWNGSSWRIVTARGPAGAAFSSLNDVACPSAGFCLVVGVAGGARRFHDTAYTWHAGTWRRLALPRPRRSRNSELGGLACSNSVNCIAVGNYTSASGRYLPFAARWHDGRWELLITPAIRAQRYTLFQGISCPTATRCVAVGNTEDDTRGKFFHAFAEVWSKGKWRVSTLRRQPSYFIGVSCPARDRCVASGSTFPAATNVAHPLIETWNGRTWTAQQPARTSRPWAGDDLQHVSCMTRSRCEAVGRYRPGVPDSDQTLAETWNGQRWTVQATANP